MNNTNYKKKDQDIDEELAKQIQEVSEDFGKKLNLNVDRDAQQALNELLKQTQVQSEPKKQDSKQENLMNPFQDLQGPEGIQKLKNMFGSQQFMKANQQMMQFFADASQKLPKDGDPTSQMGMFGMPTGQMFSPEMLQAMMGGGMVPNAKPQEQPNKNASEEEAKANQSNPFLKSYMDMQNQAMNQMPMFAEGMQSMLENMGDVKNPQEFMMKFMGEFQNFMKDNEQNPNVQNFMENMMQDMMNKETLYPHMSELATELPKWLEQNQSKLSIEALEQHNKQLDIIEKLVDLFKNDFGPIDKFNDEDAAKFLEFQKENQKIYQQLKKSGESEDKIMEAMKQREPPKIDEKEIQERKKVADPIMENLMKLLQQLQDAGDLPPEVVQKVSLKRMNSQMQMFEEMAKNDKILKPQV